MMKAYSHYFILGHPLGPRQMSETFDRNSESTKILHEMAHRAFSRQSSRFEAILTAIVYGILHAPAIYAVDTEFYQPQKGGASNITKVALIDIEAGEAVVNGLSDDDQRAMKTSTQLLSGRSKNNFSTAKQVRRVRNTGR